jgi:hypothetical protein
MVVAAAAEVEGTPEVVVVVVDEVVWDFVE